MVTIFVIQKSLSTLLMNDWRVNLALYLNSFWKNCPPWNEPKKPHENRCLGRRSDKPVLLGSPKRGQASLRSELAGYTPGSSNIAVTGKWGPRSEWVDVFPMKNGDVIPAIAMLVFYAEGKLAGKQWTPQTPDVSAKNWQTSSFTSWAELCAFGADR